MRFDIGDDILDGFDLFRAYPKLLADNFFHPSLNRRRHLHIPPATDSLHVQFTVNIEYLPGNIASLLPSEKYNHFGDFLASAETAERNRLEKLLAQLLRQSRGHITFNKSRRHGIHRHFSRSHFAGQGFREADDSSLGRSVERLSDVARLPDHGR